MSLNITHFTLTSIIPCLTASVTETVKGVTFPSIYTMPTVFCTLGSIFVGFTVCKDFAFNLITKRDIRKRSCFTRQK